MTDVIGHDCEGRPLRAGDRVVLVSRPDIYLIRPRSEGAVVTVTQVEPDRSLWNPKDDPCLEIRHADGRLTCVGAQCTRKLPDDKPANQSFEELMNQLSKEGAAI